MSFHKRLVSTFNSSNTLLNIGETFIGIGEDVARFSSLTIMSSSNVAGTIHLEFSVDGVNWDITKSISTTGVTSHSFTIFSKFVRIRYVNGSAAQTYFRLQTIFHTEKSKPLTQSVNTIIKQNNDVELTRVVNDPYLDIARGYIDGQMYVNVYGRSPFMDTTEQTIWEVDANLVFPTVAEKLRIRAGGNVNDTALGTGARLIYLDGLDQNWNTVIEFLPTNGASASISTQNTFLRLNQCFVLQAGTREGRNIGNVIIENETTNLNMGTIIPEYGRINNSNYTIPAGHVGYLINVNANVEVTSQKFGTIYFNSSNQNIATVAPFAANPRIALNGVQGYIQNQVFSKIGVPEKTDIWFSATSTANNTIIDVGYDIILTKL